MADETWPSTLPQRVEKGGFAFELTSSSMSTAMSTGYAKRRKRFTGQYAHYVVTLHCTVEQLDIFEQFFNNNLGYGVVLFDFPDPLFFTETIEGRIVCGAETVPYTMKPYKDSDDALLTFTFERLISGYNTVSTTEWPITLPQCPLHSGYQASTQSGVIRDSSYELGVITARRRFTAVTRSHTLSFVMSRDQLGIFFDFYASLGYGSLAFTAPFPFDDSRTMKTRFDTTNGYGYAVTYYKDSDLFSVVFIWEELPLLKEIEV